MPINLSMKRSDEFLNKCTIEIASFDSFVNPDIDGYVFSEKLLQEKHTYLTQEYLQTSYILFWLITVKQNKVISYGIKFPTF